MAADVATELQAAISAARAAGEILRDGLGKAHSVEHKGPTDLVTEVDRASEALILQVLHAATPAYGFVAEESAAIRGDGEARWIVDPLDGTTNYAHGQPYFAVSIGLERRGQLELGVIYNPLRDELFVARRGRGATLNGRPIHASATASLSAALVATGYPYDVWQAERDNVEETISVLKRAQSLRVNGSSSLDLAAVACGRLDAYWEPGLSPWDVAAGTLLVREAGGLASDYGGGPDTLYQGEILAATPAVHAEMLAHFRGRHRRGRGIGD